MTTITSGDGVTITPDLVTGFSSEADAGTIAHDLLDGTTSYSLSADHPAGGDLGLLFSSRPAAWTAYAAFAIPRVWTLADSDVPQVGMTFVRDGERRIELDDETQAVWIVTVGFRATA